MSMMFGGIFHSACMCAHTFMSVFTAGDYLKKTVEKFRGKISEALCLVAFLGLTERDWPPVIQRASCLRQDWNTLSPGFYLDALTTTA